MTGAEEASRRTQASCCGTLTSSAAISVTSWAITANCGSTSTGCSSIRAGSRRRRANWRRSSPGTRSRPSSGRWCGGAFLAQMIAAELGVEFAYAEPQPSASTGTLFSVVYRLPGTVAPLLRGKRVAIVDDAVNAGSAVPRDPQRPHPGRREARGRRRAPRARRRRAPVSGRKRPRARVRCEAEQSALGAGALPVMRARRAAGRGPDVKGGAAG